MNHINQMMLHGVYSIARNDYKYLLQRKFWPLTVAMCAVHGVTNDWYFAPTTRAALGFCSSFKFTEFREIVGDAIVSEELKVIKTSGGLNVKPAHFICWCIKKGWKLPPQLTDFAEAAESINLKEDDDI